MTNIFKFKSQILGTLPFAVGDCNGLVREGRLLVFGGGEGDSFHEEILAIDPTSGKVEEVGRLPAASRGHQVVELDGRIYVLGGFNGATLDTVWEIDLAAGKAHRRAPLPTTIAWFGAAAHQGRIAVIGGFTIPDGYLDGYYSYDPASDSWEQTAGVVDSAIFPKACLGANALVSVGDVLVTVGGADSFDVKAGRSTALPQVTSFDPRGRTWSRLGDLEVAREGIAVARQGDTVYLVGGMDEHSPQPSRRVERLDLASGKVEAVAELQVGRLTPAAGIVGGRLVVAGGVTKPLAEMTDTIEIVDVG